MLGRRNIPLTLLIAAVVICSGLESAFSGGAGDAALRGPGPPGEVVSDEAEESAGSGPSVCAFIQHCSELRHAEPAACRQRRVLVRVGNRDRSAVVRLTIHDGGLILESPSQPLLEGESLTLCCRIRGFVHYSGVFYKDSRELRSSADGQLIISAASLTDTGSYRCKHATWRLSSPSSRVTVRGSGLRPVLAVSPSGQLYRGETVLLSCRVAATSADWTFLFFQSVESSRSGSFSVWHGGQYEAILPLSEGAGAAGSYRLHPDALTRAGTYWCRAQRHNQALYTPYSNALRLQLSEKQPQARLTAHTSRAGTHEGDTVTLLVQRGQGISRLLQPVQQLHVRNCDRAHHQSQPDRVARGDSNKGGALTLTCETELQELGGAANLSFSFLRDGQPVANSSDSGVYSVLSTEAVHAGRYSCTASSERASKRSQEVHVHVKDEHCVPTQMFGLGAVSLLTASLTLCWKCLRARARRHRPPRRRCVPADL
ncbi:hypothetical protein MATL_G00014620 [Megalops atlanticus]|uniref:Ig-like domain-containing protein n=1 Tax=Megalops atlanticus TaxID=7932 RepID=A0A9D3QLQ5_MEGAT|nr:hypothetical protein MATL_G00014620 [Megalops atlanticus]